MARGEFPSFIYKKLWRRHFDKDGDQGDKDSDVDKDRDCLEKWFNILFSFSN